MSIKKRFPKGLTTLLFDMDGVLYDSMPNHAESWMKSFKAEGIDFPAYDAYIHEGRTATTTVEEAFKKYVGKTPTTEDVERIYNRKSKILESLPSSPIMPYMQEVFELSRNAGYKIIVVTGSKQPSLLNRLTNDYKISRENVVCGNDVINGKPHPEPFLTGLKKAQSSANESLVIENAPLGIRSARAAQIRTVAINSGILDPKELTKEGAETIFSNSKEFLQFWKDNVTTTH
ncbi:HAD family phosphatase [Marinilabiliaceae bacterium ANBcel2]|nr:HAD family phosphatase [Marinilabiliaceae bacterium ANBcel2]